MKRKLLTFFISLTMITSILSGCILNTPGDTTSTNQFDSLESTQSTVTDDSTESTINVNYDNIYNEILDKFYNLITSETNEYNAQDGEAGVIEAVANKGKNYAAASVGYIIKDISGDSIPELLIVSADEIKDSICYGNNVFAAYTCVDNVPTLIFERSSRSNYCIIGDGKFLHVGSDGAMYTAYGTYDISDNGKELVCNNFYFTYEKDTSGSEMGFYHNTSGEMDKSISEELNMTDNEFNQKVDELFSSIANVAITPFLSYKDNTVIELSDTVNIAFADNVLIEEKPHDLFVTDYSEFMVDLLFTTDSRVNNFKVLSLEIEDVDSDGNIKYKTTELYSLALLTNDYPLVFKTTIVGDLPSYAISYDDSHGNNKIYAIALSGEDGSPLLLKI